VAEVALDAGLLGGSPGLTTVDAPLADAWDAPEDRPVSSFAHGLLE